MSATRNKVDGMGYRELHRMEIEEVVRRWQVNESQRAIARATGLARETVKKYLAAASDLGLSATGPPPAERELVELRRLGVVAAQPIMRVAPQAATLEAYRDQIASWIDDDHLLLTRVQELLGQYGVPVAYTTLRRYVRQAGLWKQPRSTVRMAPTAPGEVAEMDFGKLGTLINPVTGRRQVVWGLLVVLVYSRYSFFWPLVQQTVEATIEGLDGRGSWARRPQPATNTRVSRVQPGARSDPGPCSRAVAKGQTPRRIRDTVRPRAILERRDLHRPCR